MPRCIIHVIYAYISNVAIKNTRVVEQVRQCVHTQMTYIKVIGWVLGVATGY